MHLQNGTLLCNSRYRINGILGQGSFGITYIAADLKNGNVSVAIKEFFMQSVNGREGSMVTSSSQGGLFDYYKEKFLHEARLLSGLRHDGIVRLTDIFEENSTAYYVMELIPGGTLEEEIQKRQRFNDAAIRKYTLLICNSLEFMHSNHLLHLDLKPGNIMLRNDGSPVLIDFGLTKKVSENGYPETSTTIGAGTPGYAPIEQVNPTKKEMEFTMDIYALGGIMYKMATGQRPPDASEVLNYGLPHINSAYSDIIRKAMSPLKKDRFQSVADLRQAIFSADNENTIPYQSSHQHDNEQTHINNSSNSSKSSSTSASSYQPKKFDKIKIEEKKSNTKSILFISAAAVVLVLLFVYLIPINEYSVSIQSDENIDNQAYLDSIAAAEALEEQNLQEELEQQRQDSLRRVSAIVESMPTALDFFKSFIAEDELQIDVQSGNQIAQNLKNKGYTLIGHKTETDLDGRSVSCPIYGLNEGTDAIANAPSVKVEILDMEGIFIVINFSRFEDLENFKKSVKNTYNESYTEGQTLFLDDLLNISFNGLRAIIGT